MKLKGKKGEFYFHTLCHGGRLANGDGRSPELGEWLRARYMYKDKSGVWRDCGAVSNPEECNPGMHACKTNLGIQLWGKTYGGAILCVVKLRGKVKHFKDDKSVALERKIVAMRKIPNAANFRGIRSEDLARWVFNHKLNWPKVRK